MIKGILALLLALSISAEAMASKRKAEDEETETRVSKTVKSKKVKQEGSETPSILSLYSDERPKSKCIFSVDLTDRYGWDKNNKKFRITQSRIFFHDLFLKEAMTHLGGSRCYDNNHYFTVYGKVRKPDSLVAIEIQNNHKSLSPHFDKITIPTPPISDILKLWCITGNKNQHYLLTINKEVMEGSWNCINRTIHWMHFRVYGYKNNKHPEEGKFLKYFYNRVRKNGLEKSLHRIAIVINNDNQCSFNVLYNTDEEVSKGTKFILSTFGDLIPKT